MSTINNQGTSEIRSPENQKIKKSDSLIIPAENKPLDERQIYLRSAIIDSGYNAEKFVDYLETVKSKL